jgi:hypothetical protein
MSGVLHPVGPEPPRTYWLRRALVLGVLAAVLAVLISLLTPGSGDGPVTATPGPTVATPLPSDGGTSSPSPTRSLTPTATTTPAPTGSSSPTPSPTTRGNAGPARPTACDPAQLRTRLQGQERLKPQQSTTFTVSVTNESPTSCVATVTGRTFELRIYSGADRIWSSNDCATAVKTVKTTLGGQQATQWQMAWNGRRSAPGCTNREAIPQNGTYIATAQLSGGRPVQLRMTLAG